MADSGSQYCILVVDDDPIICTLLNAKLTLCGFDCQPCNSAREALDLLSKRSFDAIISDLNMPGMSGLELLEATRNLAPRPAFLMATGVSDVSVGVTAMKQGASDYLVKPFQMDAVVAALLRALEIKRSGDYLREQVVTAPEGKMREIPAEPGMEMLAVALVEGWRGEVCHAAITDTAGRFRRYKIIDPSFRNWSGLGLAMRGTAVSDFPICNKSFNLSYCGFDL